MTIVGACKFIEWITPYRGLCPHSDDLGFTYSLTHVNAFLSTFYYLLSFTDSQ